MKNRSILICMTLLMILGSQLTAQYPVGNDGKSPFVQVVKDVRESVVNIRVESEVTLNRGYPFDDDFFRFFFNYRTPQQKQKVVNMGSGFIFKTEGTDVFILTNNHVVERGKNGEIKVTLADRAEFAGTIVGSDPPTDLAIVKITVPKNEKVVVAKLGQSENLEIGDWVIAIGNPFGQLGLERTVTVGVVSAKERSLDMGETSPAYQDYIQTDAAINPGNSGGPLLNLKGEVIGVNAAITSPSGGNVGIGFAIPVDMAKKVISDILSKGKVVRAYLGILPQDLDQTLVESLNMERVSGILVAHVEPDTPAESAGLKNGDVILTVNDREVTNVSKFKVIVSNLKVGEKAKIRILRDGKEQTLNATLASMPGEDEAPISKAPGKQKDLGIEVRDVNSAEAKRFNVNSDRGVVITRISRDSPLNDLGIVAGDVILEINRQRISDTDDYNRYLNKALSGDVSRILFHILTKSGYQYVAVKL